MTKFPRISKSLQTKHTGESAAIVDGKFVAFGKNTVEVVKKAERKGYRLDEIMVTYIMGKKNYALPISVLRR